MPLQLGLAYDFQMTNGPTSVLRVMLADDSAAMRDRLTSLVSQIPNATVIATVCDGQEALDRARDLRPDVLVLDLSMPRVGGLAVLEQLRGGLGQSTIIVFTNQTEAAYRGRCLAAGADAFLSKSTQVRTLEQILQRLALS